MSADLHIHVLEGASEADIASFSSNTLGSKHFHPRTVGQSSNPEVKAAHARVSDTPNIWIGQVSWLKAALFGDRDTYVPSAVQTIYEVIGEDLPVLDLALLKKIIDALSLDNDTGYSLAEPAEVEAFLNQHMGKRLFTISW